MGRLAFDLPAPYGTVSSGAAANGSDHAPPKTASIRGTSQSPLRLCARSGFTCTIVIRHSAPGQLTVACAEQAVR